MGGGKGRPVRIRPRDGVVMDIGPPVVAPLGFGPRLYRDDAVSRIDDDAGRAGVVERPWMFFEALVCRRPAPPDAVHVRPPICHARRVRRPGRFERAGMKRSMGVFGANGVGYPGLGGDRTGYDERRDRYGYRNGRDADPVGHKIPLLARGASFQTSLQPQGQECSIAAAPLFSLI